VSFSWFFLSFPLTLVAQSGINLPAQTSQPEAWLITYAPGEIYWQRFGHNAIWIRDDSEGINHTYNFGFFDFNQENFIVGFLQGKMLYFALAQPVEREFEQYRNENRSITAQKLNLGPVAFGRLRDYLVDQVQPANRDYLYDYYLNNCSTRVRDALDFALGGAVKMQFGQLQAQQNFRDHTRRSTASDFWYYLGLETALGLPVDRNISQWDEMFLPSVVADVVAELKIDGVPLAGKRMSFFKADSGLPPAETPAVWPKYLLVSLLFTALFLVLARFAGPVMVGGSALAWLLINASGGLVLAGLWFFTDHAVASPNANLLLLSPLFVFGLWPVLRKFTSFLIIGGLVLALIQNLLPGAQYNLDILAFMAPLNVACAWWLWRQSGSRNSEASG